MGSGNGDGVAMRKGRNLLDRVRENVSVVCADMNSVRPPGGGEKTRNDHSSSSRILRSDRPRCLAPTAFDDGLPPLPSPDSSLPDAHPPRHVPLRDYADRQAQRLLHPFAHPFPGVDAAGVDDLLDLFGDLLRGTGPVVAGDVLAALRVEPVRPLLRDGLRDGGEGYAVDGVVQVDGEDDEVLGCGRVVDHDVLAGLCFRLFDCCVVPAREVVRGRRVADCLYGEEDVAAAHGVTFAQRG